MLETSFFLAGIIIGFVITKLASKKGSTEEMNISENYVQKVIYNSMLEENKAKSSEITALTGEISTYKERVTNLDSRIIEHKKEIEQLKESMALEFKVLSSKIFEENSTKFIEINEQKVGAILNPLKEKIRDFELKIERNYNEETKEKATLKKELEIIIQLNKQVSDDANRLTNALKGDKKLQGNWGEVQLEMILNRAGLQKDVHYRSQAVLESAEGKVYKPDYIINLPDDKHLILDSKVSLVAYEQFFNEEDENIKATHLKTHASNIQKHITGLSEKNYQKLYNINPPDYVLMFVPLEPALFAALKEDGNLFEKALEKNIVLVSTSTLLATLRTISYIWKQDNQRKNVFEIAEESGALYDKFVGFIEDLTNIGKKLDEAKVDYDNAFGKLSKSQKKGTTIIGRLERIKKLGANTTKSIPQNLIDKSNENETS